MAKSFSIGRSLSEAFGQYAKNWLTLTLAGAIASSIWLVDFYNAQNLNRINNFFKHEIAQSANAQEAWEKTTSFVSGIFQNTGDFSQGPLVLFLEILLMLYLTLGLINFCMHSVGKGKASFENFLIRPSEFLRFVGAVCVVVAVGLLFLIGLGAVFVMAKWFQLPVAVTLLVAWALIFLMGIYLLHFIFIPYCVVDKAKSIMDAVDCSKKMIEGNIWELFGFALVFFIILSFVSLLLLLVFQPVTALIPLEGIDFFLVSSIMAPIMKMGYLSVYRQLK